VPCHNNAVRPFEIDWKQFIRFSAPPSVEAIMAKKKRGRPPGSKKKSITQVAKSVAKWGGRAATGENNQTSQEN